MALEWVRAGRCFDVHDASVPQLWACHGGANQAVAAAVDGSTSRWGSMSACLEVQGGRVALRNCSRSAGQAFTHIPKSGGTSSRTTARVSS
jgi:hypothetical protein